MIYEDPDPALVLLLGHVRTMFEARLDEIKDGGALGKSFFNPFFGCLFGGWIK
jgi:hypothetical protein